MNREQIYTRGSEELTSLATNDRIPVDDVSDDNKKGFKYITEANLAAQIGGGGTEFTAVGIYESSFTLTII